jgi:hypothetical protein
VRLIQETLAGYGPDTTRVLQPYVLGLLAECQLRLGSFEEAARHLDEGLILAERLGERFWEPELFRLRGVVELALPEGRPKVARTYLIRALRQAHEQRAKSTERRVTIDTSKLPVEFQWSEAQARSLMAGMRLSS